MGGEANMFRISIVLHCCRIPVISGIMAYSRHAERFSNLVSVEFHSIVRNYAGYVFVCKERYYYSLFRYASSSSFKSCNCCSRGDTSNLSSISITLVTNCKAAIAKKS
jgi:hypothetical protein